VAEIQADFWNGDPDLDAVCRMEHGPECDFDPACFPLMSSKPAPFNSQNTFLSANVLPHYFLFPHIGRMDDIWASYYVQALAFKAVFNRASVYQQRNAHNLTHDMRQEYLGYEQLWRGSGRHLSVSQHLQARARQSRRPGRHGLGQRYANARLHPH